MYNKIRTTLRRASNLVSTIYVRFFVARLTGMQLGSNVRFKRIPQIIMHKDASIAIGSGTTINSDNYGYHINMHSRSKLIADRSQARLQIGESCRIHGTCIHAFNRIEIGNNVLVAANTQIIDGNGHELSFPDVENRIKTTDSGKPIYIEDNVWIGANCVILGGVTIGAGAVISANSVIHKDVPSNCVAGGNPFRVIKTFDSQ